MEILKLLKFVFYFVLTFLAFFIIGFYSYYKYKYPEYPKINSEFYNWYSKDIILKTGGNLAPPQERLQHFLNFPVEKDKKTIRIGAFGDSHT
ncbi:MAG: hypothetical protein OXJ52_06095, partial [Oligoflexia bacterium]|nr:hypothetical protein [Oligoflexia bacterium]